MVAVVVVFVVCFCNLSLCVCFCSIRFSFFSTQPRDWLRRPSLKSWMGRTSLNFINCFALMYLYLNFLGAVVRALSAFLSCLLITTTVFTHVFIEQINDEMTCLVSTET